MNLVFHLRSPSPSWVARNHRLVLKKEVTGRDTEREEHVKRRREKAIRMAQNLVQKVSSNKKFTSTEQQLLLTSKPHLFFATCSSPLSSSLPWLPWQLLFQVRLFLLHLFQSLTDLVEAGKMPCGINLNYGYCLHTAAAPNEDNIVTPVTSNVVVPEAAEIATSKIVAREVAEVAAPGNKTPSAALL